MTPSLGCCCGCEEEEGMEESSSEATAVLAQLGRMIPPMEIENE